LFAAHGANEVYARIATTQKYRIGSADHSMDRGLERARSRRPALGKKAAEEINAELYFLRFLGNKMGQNGTNQWVEKTISQNSK
jgi:hypothetical protein